MEYDDFTRSGRKLILEKLQHFGYRIGQKPGLKKMNQHIVDVGSPTTTLFMAQHFGPCAGLIAAGIGMGTRFAVRHIPASIGRISVLRSSLEWPIEAEWQQYAGQFIT